MEKFLFFIFLYILLNYKIMSQNSSSIKEALPTSKINIIYNINKTKEKELNINHEYSQLRTKKKNLIIGAISNYSWKKVSIFFKSYEKVKFENCDCVMFVRKMSQDTIDKIKSCGVTIYEIPIEFKNVDIINSRWKIYENFINDNKGKYNLILTADLRDVFFQSDIFKLYENNKPFLGIALEDLSLTEFRNKKWLINAYGEKLYKTIEHERIICVGTIWGTVDKFGEFSKIMWEKLNSEWSLNHNVIEQAVGNFIIYHDKMFKDCLVKSESKDGPVMTIGLVDLKRIKFDSENNILNSKNEIGSVIHQYDRYKEIEEKIINKYYPEYKNIPEIKKLSPYIIIYAIPLLIFLIIISIIIILYNYHSKNKVKLINLYHIQL